MLRKLPPSAAQNVTDAALLSKNVRRRHPFAHVASVAQSNTDMATTAFNDVAACILLSLAVALTGKAEGIGNHKIPLISVWVLLSILMFVILMITVIQPAMKLVVRRCLPEHDTMDEVYICLTLAGLMILGFVTDLIEIYLIFDAFMFGLMISNGGDFVERLIQRIEDFVYGLLLPLYFASSGLKTDEFRC